MGDPHITTLDGYSYTFNGLGEYWLIKSKDGNFSCQGRTLQMLSKEGNLQNATVWGAFVGSTPSSDIVVVELNKDRSGKAARLTLCLYIMNICPNIYTYV